MKFKISSNFVESPTHIEVEGAGEDIAKAGHFVQKSVVDLREISPSEVEVSYRTDATIVGKLAMFGDRMIRAKRKRCKRNLQRLFNRGSKAYYDLHTTY